MPYLFQHTLASRPLSNVQESLEPLQVRTPREFESRPCAVVDLDSNSRLLLFYRLYESLFGRIELNRQYPIFCSSEQSLFLARFFDETRLPNVVLVRLLSARTTVDESVRHIGPMAQDFMETFGYGTDDRYIAAVDVDGIALAAIQGLNKKLEERDQVIAAQDKKLSDLEGRLAAIETALAR